MKDLMILHVFRVTTSEEGHLNRTQASSLIYSHLDHVIKKMITNDQKVFQLTCIHPIEWCCTSLLPLKIEAGLYFDQGVNHTLKSVIY